MADIVDDAYSTNYYALSSKGSFVYTLNASLAVLAKTSLNKTAQQNCQRLYPFYQNKQLTYLLAFCFDSAKGYYAVLPMAVPQK